MATNNVINKTIDAPVFTGEINANSSVGNIGDVLTSAGAGFPAVWSPASGGGFAWAPIAADGSFVNGQGVIVNKAGLLSMTLPLTAAVGTVIAIQGTAVGVAGWLIVQNAGQNIWLQDTSTTPGAGGSLASTLPSDGVTLLCTVADTTWNSISAGGNITVV